jgi:hypothetical protein
VAITEKRLAHGARFFDTIANRPDAVHKLVEKRAKEHRRIVDPTNRKLFGSALIRGADL